VHYCVPLRIFSSRGHLVTRACRSACIMTPGVQYYSTVKSACDLSLRWKLLNCGGGLGTSGTKNPCCSCPLHGSSFNTQNSEKYARTCEFCKNYRRKLEPDGTPNPLYDPEIKCYQYSVHIHIYNILYYLF